MKNPSPPRLSRRLLLQYPVACAAAAAAAASQTVAAQGLTGPAYEVRPWAGPVSAFSLVDTNGKAWGPADLRGRAV
ncbi:MAG: hypothetical protein JF626_07115, partial [Polaromonas sp.]|nr:hypothetical protein [Polaromonas sp.]